PDVLARNEKTESSSVGVAPPFQVTRVTVASSPLPFVNAVRFQPGVGKNESMVKPFGGVSSTDVVVTFSFSVGTASVKTCSSSASAAGGLTSACAAAPAAATSAPSATSTQSAMQCLMCPPSFDVAGQITATRG